ncbi:MAG: YceI family protein [Bacteroidota bacterium]|nr:YceI family protein [Bacteroidota bacterium]
MRKTLFSSLLLALLLASGSPLQAQESFVLADGSTIRVDGTSNRSDWSVEATGFSGTFNVVEGIPASGSLIIAVRDMKGGRSLIMDRLMYSAFDADANPEIVFTLESVEASETEGMWTINGQLAMAGASNAVAVELEQKGNSGRTIRYEGSHALKMTDFGMKPPTAMFGSLHTQDDVSIHFDLLLASTCEEDCPSDGDSGR